MKKHQNTVDTSKLYRYWEREYLDPRGVIRTWEAPLSEHVEETEQHELRRIRYADELHRKQRTLWNNLYAKVVHLPVSKGHGGGAGMIVITMELAEVLGIPETVAYEIIQDMLATANRRAAITSKASYRTTKSKLSLL